VNPTWIYVAVVYAIAVYLTRRARIDLPWKVAGLFYALAAYAERSGVDPRFAGTGLQTFLRLAASDASVWQPIIDSNHEAIGRHLAAVIEIARAMDETAFADAQQFVKRL